MANEKWRNEIPSRIPFCEVSVGYGTESEGERDFAARIVKAQHGSYKVVYLRFS
jgi:hypothetical protein